MAGSVNKVILVGNLGRDPEVKSMQDGRSMVNMSIATSDTWRDRQSGERKERTEWHRVVIFNEKLAEVAQKFVRKHRTAACEIRRAPLAEPAAAARHVTVLSNRKLCRRRADVRLIRVRIQPAFRRAESILVLRQNLYIRILLKHG